MEKRHLLFLLISMVIWIGYIQLVHHFAPPAPPAAPGEVAQQEDRPVEGAAPEQAAPQQDVVEQDGAEQANLAHRADNGQPTVPEIAAAEGTAPSTAPITAPPANAAKDGVPEPAARAGILGADRDHIEHPWRTIGSLDPESPYRMLVYLQARGGGIARIEMNETEYRDLDTSVGYLGFLAGADGPQGGCRVQVVGTGTPAALAVSEDPQVEPGLQPDDVIVRWNDEPIETASDLDQQILHSRPNQEVRLAVQRPAENGPHRELMFTVRLIVPPLAIIDPNLAADDESKSPSFLLSLERLGNRRTEYGKPELPDVPSLRHDYWEIATHNEQTIEFRARLDQTISGKEKWNNPIEVTKRYTLAKVADGGTSDTNSKYHLDFQIGWRNLGTEPEVLQWRIDGPQNLPIEGWWYTVKTHPTSWSRAGVRDIVYRLGGGSHQMVTNARIVKQTNKDPRNPETNLLTQRDDKTVDYIGVDTQYFVVALLGQGSLSEESTLDGLSVDQAYAQPIGPEDTVRQSRTDVSFRLVSPTVDLAPGASQTYHWQIFAGPKVPEVLESYGLKQSIVYGWFGPVARTMLAILHFFYHIVGNYGIAIILLTVLVRACMFPLSYQQVMNAQKMQELAPEMKRISEQYKNDVEKRARAQQELFRKNNYHPLSGCLPAFLQLPILVGLYRALSVDIALRGASLIPGIPWATSLAAPDKLLYWEPYLPSFLAGPNGYLGPYLNLLPLITVGLFLVQQKMFTPPAVDEQQVMQQKVMSFMTVLLGFMFFNVPSGLCVYFITSSLWGLAERKLLPKKVAADKTASARRETSATNGHGATLSERAKRRDRR